MKIPYGIIISFIAGIATGIGATYKYFDHLHSARADEEIDSVKAKLAASKRSAAFIYTGDDQNRDAPVRTFASMVEKPDPAEIINTHTTVQTKSDEDVDVEESEEDNNVIVEPVDYANPKPQPYLISEDQYYADTSLEKDTLTYYEADETLADTRDEIVDNVRETVGDALDSFDNEQYIYVRNERLGLDFEIERREMSYQEAVYGYIPPSGQNTKKARERAGKRN